MEGIHPIECACCVIDKHLYILLRYDIFKELSSSDCRDELFASLFGKKPEYKVVENEDEEVSDVVILR